MNQQVRSAKLPAAIGPFSHAIRAGSAVYVSGQIGMSPQSGDMPEDVSSQARQAITNLIAVLEAAGLGLKDVVKTTVYLNDMDDFSVVNAIYAEYFSEPFPARACFQVVRLPRDAKFEIEAVASC